jgi:O-antigen/teichoic acid export membrane protein
VGGWSTATKKRFSETDIDPNQIVGAQFLFSVIFGTLALVGSFGLRTQIESYTGLQWFHLLALLLPVIFFYPFQGFITARGEVGKQTWIDTLRSVFTTPFQVGLVILGFGAGGMVWGYAAATLFVLPLTFYYLRVRASFPTRETLRSTWSFAKHSIPNSVVGHAYDRYDVLLLGALVGSGSVANYEVALKMSLPAMFVGTIASSILMPRVSNLRSKGENVSQDITNVLSFSSILAVPIFFGALAFPDQLLVTAYGPKYSDAGWFLVGLALYRLIRTQTRPISKTFDGLELPDINFKIGASTLALNLVTGLVLVLQVGAIGVVIATIISELFRYLILVSLIRTEVPDIDFFTGPLTYQVGSGVVMFGAVELLTRQIQIASFIDVGIIIGSSGVIYVSVLLLNTQIRMLVVNIVQGVINKI